MNKPQGYSSFDVVRIVRAILKEKKVGHCGTLDPMATGILLIVYGKATKISEKLMSKNKTYFAKVTLGIKTDSGDKTGKILETSETLPQLSDEKLRETFKKFEGDIVQKTPMHSAAKRGGKKLYEYARAAELLTQSMRHITIYSLQLEAWCANEIQFTVECSSGTYIRTLAEDLGEALGCPATLSFLERTKSGQFVVENSLNLETVRAMSRENLLQCARLVHE